GSAAGLAVDLQLAAEHLDALEHAGKAKATKDGCIQECSVTVEATSVVFDGDDDGACTLDDRHADVRSATVLANVGEGLAYDLEDRDPPRLRQVGKAAVDLEVGFDSGLIAQCSDFARDLRVKCLDRLLVALDRRHQRSERLVDGDQARLQVVEATVDAVADVFLDERNDLATHRRELRSERRQLLQSTVMQVEGETAQTTLESDDVTLGMGLQEQLGLERGACRRRRRRRRN